MSLGMSSERDWIASAAVRPRGVVMGSPPFNEHLCFQQGIEQFTVEQLVAEIAVKRLNVTVFPGTARRDEQRSHFDPAKPFTDVVSSELRSIVAADILRYSAANE